MKAPRVLVSGVVLSQPMGGVRRHNAEILPRAAKLLAERGGSLSVMLGRDRIEFELPEPIELLESTVPPAPALSRAAHESLWLRRHVARAADLGRPFDVVHTAHLPAPRGIGAPFTLTLHDLKSVASSREPFVRRLVGGRVLADAIDRAARVITVSQTLRDEVRELFGTALTKLDVVPNGADHLPYLPRRPRENAPLLCVGHLEPRKNVELVLRAIAFDATLPVLELAGEAKGDEEQYLRGIARELQIEARVRFLGLRDDQQLAQLYASCACVVVPSLREGFCIPAAEARRARAPLAVSNLPVLLEVAGASTPNFAPDDPAQCARAIHAAIEGAGGKDAPSFTWRESAVRLVAAWQTAAKR